MKHWVVPTAAFIVIGLILPTPVMTQQAVAPTLDSTFAQIRTDHQQVLDELNGHGHPLDLGDPRAAKILKRGWTLAGEWASAYFEAHRSPDLERVFDGFAPKPHGLKSQYGDFLEYHDYNFDGSTMRLGPEIYVVQGRYWMDNETGGFMVVARGADGYFHALWSIKDLAEEHYPQRDEIGRWMYLVGRAYYNGPLAIEHIFPLPPAANGDVRFFVHAYQSADGGTALAQLSIWEWDGTEAKPLLVDGFVCAVGYADLQFNDPFLRIRTKEKMGILFACGMCPEPQGVWTIRITPDGVEDLGHQFLYPEIQWADDLLSKIAKGVNTDDLAEGKAVMAVQARMKEVKAEYATLGLSSSDFSWGLLDHYKVIKRGQRGTFDVITDQGNLRFRYVIRKGKPYFTDIQIR